MVNFFLICTLFLLIIILFVQLSGVKSRLRLIEYLLEKQQGKTSDIVSTKPTEVITEIQPRKTAVSKAEKAPSENILTLGFKKLYEFFTGGNSFVRIGILVLFIGVAFLLKYAAQFGYFTVGMRLISVAILAIILFIIGYLLEKKRFVYAMTLEGGALAILYLLCFTAFYRFQILTAGVTVPLLIAITAFTVFCAIKHKVKSLAVLGIIGGFVAPILVNTPNPDALLLFGYYLILNIGIFIITWFRQWRELNILGFIFTFVVTGLWYWHGDARYEFYIAESFLFIFFGFYLIVAILSAIKQPPNLKGFVEGPLVFGLPLVTFSLQAYLYEYAAHPLAVTAIGLGIVYAILSFILTRLTNTAFSILASAFAAIAVVFFTLAIPLLLTGEWTSAVWALEAAALIWVGIKQQRYLLRFLGIIIAILANLYFYYSWPSVNLLSSSPWFSNEIFNYTLLTITNLLSAYFFYSAFDKIKSYEKIMAYVFFAIGALWWLAVDFRASRFYFSENYQDVGYLILVSASSILAVGLAKISRCSWFKVISFSLLPLMILLAFFQCVFFNWDHWISGYWIIGFTAWIFILWIYREEDSDYLKFGHLGSYLLMTALVTWYGYQKFLGMPDYSETWLFCVWGVIPALFLLILHFSLESIKTLFSKFVNIYAEVLSLCFVIYLLFWLLIVNLQLEGTANPFSYYLVLNLLDLSSILALLALSLRCFQGKNALVKISSFNIALPAYAITIVSFIWANAAILRFLHFYYAVPFTTEGFLASQLTQVVLSLFWGLLALLTTIVANQKQWRPLWFVGATMILITIVKLFLIDLSNSGTLERIIAFIGVGVILLLIGYFAPLPPKQKN